MEEGGGRGDAGCLPRHTNTGLASGTTSSQSLHTHCCLMGSHLAMGCVHSHRVMKEAGWWVGGGGGGVGVVWASSCSHGYSCPFCQCQRITQCSLALTCTDAVTAQARRQLWSGAIRRQSVPCWSLLVEVPACLAE